MYCNIQAQSLHPDVFELFLDYHLDLTRGHQRLMVLKSVPGTTHAVQSALFKLDKVTLPVEASDESPKSGV